MRSESINFQNRNYKEYDYVTAIQNIDATTKLYCCNIKSVMESDALSECDKDESGRVIDPITYNEIPSDRVIIVTEGNGRWCMDILSLLEQAVVYGNELNPMTRSPLNDNVRQRLIEYRRSQMITFTVDNGAVGLLSKNGMFTFSIDSFYLIGDLHIKCLELANVPIVEARVSLGNKYLDEMKLDVPVSVLRSRRYLNLSIVDEPVTGRSYRELKVFVAKFDRYKYQFSPFPQQPDIGPGYTMKYAWYAIKGRDPIWELYPSSRYNLPPTLDADRTVEGIDNALARELSAYALRGIVPSPSAMRVLGQLAIERITREKSIPDPRRTVALQG